ncbi:MAG TPA: sigma-70 family RNA polymerase sigma factor [Terriglobales bacterium]|nr:sigma-70 family RNA polymerase sigma factor [Terriglobales bacterium]
MRTAAHVAKKAPARSLPVSLVRSGYGKKAAQFHRFTRHSSRISWAPASAPAKNVSTSALPQPPGAVPNVPKGSPNRLEENALTAALVRRCIAGDAVAWEELVRQQNRRIYNICYRFTGSGNDAEDLTQEVFIRLYRTMSSYEPDKGSFTTWLTTLTRNMLVDHFRRTRQERMTDSIDAAPAADEDAPTLAERLEDHAPSAQSVLSSKETQKMVQQALQKVSPDLREAVILRDLQDMDYKEIAATLKVPEGTVKSRINRGRAELARLLSRTYKQAN